MQHTAEFNHIHLAATFTRLGQQHALWSMEQQGSSDLDLLLQQLAMICHELLPGCGAREAANIMHSLAKLRCDRADMIKGCVKAFLGNVSNAQPKEVTIVMWSLATLAERRQACSPQAAPPQAPYIMSTCFSRLCTSSERPNPHSIAMALHAAAKLRHLPSGQQLQQLLQDMASQILDGTLPRHISLALWALSEFQQLPGWRSSMVQRETVEALVAAFIGKLGDASDQDISTCALAVARSSTPSGKGAPAVIRRDVASMAMLACTQGCHVASLSAQSIANIAWARGAMGVYDASFFPAVHAAVSEVLHSISPQALSNVAWAAATVGYPGGGALVSTLVGETARRLDGANAVNGANGAGFSHQHLSNLCWAAAICNIPISTQPALAQQLKRLHDMLADHWDVTLQGKQLEQEAMWQLAQLHIWLHDNHQPAMLPVAQLRLSLDAWKGNLKEFRHNSRLQGQVFSSLMDLQHCTRLDLHVVPQQEVFTSDGLFSMDMLAVLSGRQLAIEVDGPQHFTYPDRLINGMTAFRNKALTARGYTVVSIPWFEWQALHTHAQRLAYLDGKLKDATQSLGL